MTVTKISNLTIIKFINLFIVFHNLNSVQELLECILQHKLAVQVIALIENVLSQLAVA